ncbi:hypothetical protein CAL7716_058790 [Calothrix sp. PCC 7716]|nr:hypothetical protein CAL7716_058790 [Calothrix sp. PCC 7716]
MYRDYYQEPIFEDRIRNLATNIQIKDLPSVSIKLKKQLPIISAIYFVLSESEILYIGKSLNLNNRWKTHHRRFDFLRYENITIYWYQYTEIETLIELEAYLISKYSPKINNSKIDKDLGAEIRLESFLDNDSIEVMKNIAASRKQSLSTFIENLLFQEICKYRNFNKKKKQRAIIKC